MAAVMFVRVDAPRRHARELLEALLRRGARLGRVDVQRHRVVVRCELERVRSVDIHREIGHLTDGGAHVLAWPLQRVR